MCNSCLLCKYTLECITFMTTKIEQLHQSLIKHKIHHVVFWLAILIGLMLYQGMEEGFWFTFFNNVIIVGFYAILIYLNLNYLIPKYLIPNRPWMYSLSLLLSCFILITAKEIIQLFYFELTNQKHAQKVLLASINLQFLQAFIVLIISTITKIISDWLRHTRERKELENRTMQAELRFLKSQINPHFLFNTLNNLYALTLKKDDKAPEIVIKLSEMMRYMLYECNEKSVLLQKEVAYLRNYLDLEKLRHGEKVAINLEVNGIINHQQIAPLMFIPFLENSFKHGLNQQIEKCFVNIVLNVDEDYLHFFIENGKPDYIPPPSQHRSGGIGLVNVRQRLNLLYPKSYELSIDDTPKSYAVNLMIYL